MKRTICLVLIFLLSQLLSSMVALFFFNLPNLFQASRLDVNMLADSPSAVGVSLLLNGALVWAVMTLLHWTDRKGFHANGCGKRIYFTAAAGMLPVIFLVNLLLESFSLKDLNEELLSKLIYNPLGVLAIVFVSPFAEELVFRMGIQRHLMRHQMHPWVAIVVASVIFGVIHGNPAQIPGAVIFGFVLGWLYWRSGTVWLPFMAHAVNNMLGVILMWCAGGSDMTMVELCGGPWWAAGWALIAVGLSYAAYLCLKNLFAAHGRGSVSGMERERRGASL